MLGGVASGARLDIVPAESIRPHEIADPARERRIEARLREDGILRDPLLVGSIRERGDYVLLDGTNRRRALAALNLPWTLVQIVDYADRNAVDLKTWCHAAPLSASELLDDAGRIPGVHVVPVPALESVEALVSAGTVALVLDGVETYAIALTEGHAEPRTVTLRHFVDLYEHALTRVDCEPEELEERARSLRESSNAILIAFPRFTRSQVVTMATRSLLIPAGITRHVILCGRALRVNLDLDVLRAPSLEEARDRLRRHLEGLQPRVYRETTILYDS